MDPREKRPQTKAHMVWILFCLLLVTILRAGDLCEVNIVYKVEASEMNILFIGNSYTDQIQNVFRQALSESPHKDVTVQVIWEGGATLESLINNGRAVKWIKTNNWDYVVLQEQSVRPAISGNSEQAFHDAVDLLVHAIKGVGAEPLLYMTWGRRDAQEIAEETILDYETMQQKLSDVYRKAAQRNQIRVVPVGEAWRQVRQTDAELWRRLYAKDGSHPSGEGAFLATCVFFRSLFDYPLDQLEIPEGLNVQDCSQIRDILENEGLK